MPAPDFPTAGIIYGLAGVHEGYRTGRGRVVMRARTHFEDIGEGQPPVDHRRRAALPGEQEGAARAHRRAGAPRRSSRASPTSATSPTRTACAW